MHIGVVSIITKLTRYDWRRLSFLSTASFNSHVDPRGKPVSLQRSCFLASAKKRFRFPLSPGARPKFKDLFSAPQVQFQHVVLGQKSIPEQGSKPLVVLFRPANRCSAFLLPDILLWPSKHVYCALSSCPHVCLFFQHRFRIIPSLGGRNHVHARGTDSSQPHGGCGQPATAALLATESDTAIPRKCR